MAHLKKLNLRVKWCDQIVLFFKGLGNTLAINWATFYSNIWSHCWSQMAKALTRNRFEKSHLQI